MLKEERKNSILAKEINFSMMKQFIRQDYLTAGLDNGNQVKWSQNRQKFRAQQQLLFYIRVMIVNKHEKRSIDEAV
ncbi:CLUMA_CG014788, isoform A [Clunio marinus]|uniref:CLUMA_CG014788, isoform A n=1 Tax=Clunio marinus TaxID=568069 RepID=A0A1J1IM44_9DIPT|nr:CLUMA_CG014788, isoform A [Clunio marinus]